MKGHIAGEKERKHRGALGREAPDQAFPESYAKGAASRQAVVAQGTLFERAHDEGGEQDAEKGHTILQQNCPSAEIDDTGVRLHQVEEMQNSADPKTQSEDDGDKDGHAQQGAQAIRTPENPFQAVDSWGKRHIWTYRGRQRFGNLNLSGWHRCNVRSWGR